MTKDREKGDPYDGPRDFGYITPAGRRLSEYEAVTLYIQPDPKGFDRPGDLTTRPDGRGTWNEDSTAMRCEDWFAFRDPAEMWQRPYISRQTDQERSIDRLIRHWAESGALGQLDGEWARSGLGEIYLPCAFMEHGIFRAMAYAQREALSDTLATALTLNATDKVRHAQDIVLYHIELVAAGVPIREDNGKASWIGDPIFQGCRRVIERLMATDDWAEIAVATNLVIEPLVAGSIYDEILAHGASRIGDMATTVILAEAGRDRARNLAWTRRLVELALDDKADSDHNRSVITGWLSSWRTDATAALTGLGPAAQRVGLDPDHLNDQVHASWSRLVEPFDLKLAEVGA